jgi:hypothetical protein
MKSEAKLITDFDVCSKCRRRSLETDPVSATLLPHQIPWSSSCYLPLARSVDEASKIDLKKSNLDCAILFFSEVC